MCSTCGSKTYGQEQSAQRLKDAIKLAAIRARREEKAATRRKVR
jgi:hypothetical protein